MREIIIRFLKFEALNEHPMIYAGLLAVWLTLLGVTFFSIRSQRVSVAAQWSWLSTIVFLPIFGLGIYLLWCLMRGDYPFLKFFAGRPARIESKLATGSEPA